MVRLHDMKKILQLTRGGQVAAATTMVQELLGKKSATRSMESDVLATGHNPTPTQSEAKSRSFKSAGHAPGGQFLAKSYRNAQGARAYRLYLPPGYDTRHALPLIVMLHGCTQSAEDFAAGTQMNLLAERQAFAVVYPEQSSAANQSKCWNWFKPEDQQRDRGEPAIIAGITREIIRDYPIDPARVYVAGLSAGGAQAAVMGQCYPDLYAAVGVHSGLACGAAHDMPSAFRAMQNGNRDAVRHRTFSGQQPRIVPTISFHGSRDSTVHPSNGEQVIEQAESASPTRLTRMEERGQAAGGRDYRRTLISDTSGRVLFEQWVIGGAGHAWAGGSPAGSYTDPKGPDASGEMVRFFLEHVRS